MNKQYCPICESEVKRLSRYPNYICKKCIEEDLTVKGEKVNKRDLDLEGKDPISCSVKNIPCIAKEAHLGGVVILLKETKNESI